MKLRLPKESKLNPGKNICTVCSGPKHPNYWVCKKCAKRWKLIRKPYKQWPEWVKEMIRLRRKGEYRLRVLEEIPFNPYSIDALIDENNYEQGGEGFFTKT